MYLITGAKGQLGCCLSDVFAKNKIQAYFTDIDEMDIADISSIEKYVADKNFDVVINCAAYTNVDKAEDDKEKAYAINVTGSSNLAKLAAKRNIPIIHISTDYVFGGENNVKPLSETDPVNPLGVYGKTKFDGETEIKKHAKNFVIIRTAWLYSEYGNNFLKTILRVSKEKPEIKVVADQIGTPTYAGDLAEIIVEMLNKTGGAGSLKETYHFSDEGVCSWYDFAYEIVKASGGKCEVLPIKTGEYPAKAKRPAFSVLDKSKIKKDFNLKIEHWTEGVRKCLKRLS